MAIPLVTTATLLENVLQCSLSAFPPVRQVVRKIVVRPSSAVVADSSAADPVVGPVVNPAPVGSLGDVPAAENLPPISDEVPVGDALPDPATAKNLSASVAPDDRAAREFVNSLFADVPVETSKVFENAAMPALPVEGVVGAAPAAPSITEAVAPVDRSLALETIFPAAAASSQFVCAGSSAWSSDLELNRVAQTVELSSIVSNLDAKMKEYVHDQDLLYGPAEFVSAAQIGAELDKVKAKLERVKAERKRL